MISSKFLAPAMLAFLLGAAALAQPTSEPAAAEKPAEPATPDPGQNPGSTTATGKTADANDSPFDYRASEQISEDLSVSFPVDI